ncbi:MAG: cysteine--tRNA ligase [Deltaproteobacteria bacterium]|nr:cysteine--tRNA ligase [Deltaproteobacteria bacterium]
MNNGRNNILDRIGNTPLVPITRLNPNKKVTLLAKLESSNPGGSVKDRVALCMIEAAEKTGELTKDKIIIEATSGNTGIGLALVSAVKGYRLLLLMAESASIERRKILEAFGADIQLTPARLSTDGAIEVAYHLAREEPHKYYCPDQFNNPNNPMAHYLGTGPEIWAQTNGAVTAFVATMGTTGTLMGTARALKEFNPAISIIGVEPYLGHKIQGLKNMKESYKPGIFDKREIDEIINVDDEEAFEMARQLAKQEGLFVGMSAGAAMAIALKKVRQMDEGVVVVLLADGGERYLSTTLFQAKEKPVMQFYNTTSREKEDFYPAYPPQVTMYTCGPTVFNLCNLNQCRRFVFADLVKRYLNSKGLLVKHIMNVTDLDDRTIDGSEQAGFGLREFTDRFTEEFHQDLDALRIQRADGHPRASEHVEDMVELTRKLVEKGFAYEKFRSVYYDISRFRDYGKLSRVNLSKIQVGKTVDLDDYEKDNPRDFTLLKRSTLSELKRGIFYKTEWGNVRPSWHIECAAMCMKHLGETVDIHTSGADLIFPHNENLVAIAEADCGHRVVRYWLHNELVTVNDKKMVPGQENSVTLREVLNRGYTGRLVRFLLLSQHYRKPMNFSYPTLDAAGRTLARLDEFIRRLGFAPLGERAAELDQMIYDVKTQFTQHMDDDLNISGALAALFRFIRQANPLITKGKLDQVGRDRVLELLQGFDTVLRVMEFENAELSPDAALLVQKRELARQEKKFDLADEYRDQLRAGRIHIIDTPNGPTWELIK